MSWELWFHGWAVFQEEKRGPGRGWWGPPKGTHGVGAGTVTTTWRVLKSDFKVFFGNVTQEEIESAFTIDGLQAELLVKSGDPGIVDIRVAWQDAGGNKVGEGTRKLHITQDYERTEWEGQSLVFEPAFTNKGLVTNFYDKQVALAKKMGYPKMKLHAAGTIGRYAWAKKGYEYADPKHAQQATSKFQAWAVAKGVVIPADGWPVFKSVREVAEYKHPTGVRVTKLGARGFINEDVPLHMKLELGKAFMLDKADDGHGAWHGEMLL